MYIDENSGKKYKIIGICACGIQEEIVHDIVKSICRRAEKSGFKVLLFSTFVIFQQGRLRAFSALSIQGCSMLL